MIWKYSYIVALIVELLQCVAENWWNYKGCDNCDIDKCAIHIFQKAAFSSKNFLNGAFLSSSRSFSYLQSLKTLNKKFCQIFFLFQNGGQSKINKLNIFKTIDF